jgi:hypothetical protein
VQGMHKTGRGSHSLFWWWWYSVGYSIYTTKSDILALSDNFCMLPVLQLPFHEIARLSRWLRGYVFQTCVSRTGTRCHNIAQSQPVCFCNVLILATCTTLTQDYISLHHKAK